MSYIAHEENYKGLTIKIMPDEMRDEDGPRDWENLGTMACWHRNYNLGDGGGWSKRGGKIDERRDPDDFLRSMAGDTGTLVNTDECSMETIQKIIDKHYLVLPLYLYDHSGITMNTSGFSCPWDSGQVGFIYVSHADIRKNWSVSRVNAKVEYKTMRKGVLVTERITALEAARRCLVAEVKTYDDHLTGNVYGFVVEDKDGEHVDSGWGFYPDHDGGSDYAYCLREAREQADWHIKSTATKHAAKVKEWIKNHVGLEHRTPAFA